MEAMNLVEVVLNQGTDEDNERICSNPPNSSKTTPIKGMDESVTITVTRTPGRPVSVQRIGGKPANFALMSPARNGRNSDAIRLTPREEMVCTGCQRVFKYKAAFIRHEAQCGLPIALRMERAALIEAKRQEKAAEIERRKLDEKHEKEKLPDFRCPTCLKQFSDNNSFQTHNFKACAAERASYTFTCSVCKAKFKYKNHLRRHEDSHNNVRRYNCDVCTTAFLRPDHLKRHMMRMHGIVQLPAHSAPEKIIVNPSPGPQAAQTNSFIKNAPMQCPMCNKILSRRDHLLRHLRNVHHANLDSRRGQESEAFPGSDGLPEFDLGDSYQDDEEGSESQSIKSHDGLLIDESFESVKRENKSPSPMDTDPKPDKVTVTSKYFSNSHDLEPVGPIKEKPQSNGAQLERDISNSSLKNTCPGAVEQIPDEKTGRIRSSDGNQNLLPNGHGVRNSEDWMTDLAKYNSW
ncbi:protein suppressor of hairy wing-like isoform X2 [Thrips palmi]|uniref:Protein suppressor of hairy wing-like isoform X2 n=1 Tax=Thrips palmi TaxID=161013 RepID=A0A6P8YBT1_THRPL|nr:protein suppressor of hairy wing-like isoform X2 [Thrips palmi]